jgi:hypothetical protein
VPSSNAFNASALKDTHDHSCFLARFDEHRHLMTYSPGAIIIQGPAAYRLGTAVRSRMCYARFAMAYIWRFWL